MRQIVWHALIPLYLKCPQNLGAFLSLFYRLGPSDTTFRPLVLLRKNLKGVLKRRAWNFSSHAYPSTTSKIVGIYTITWKYSPKYKTNEQKAMQKNCWVQHTPDSNNKAHFKLGEIKNLSLQRAWPLRHIVEIDFCIKFINFSNGSYISLLSSLVPKILDPSSVVLLRL